MAEREQKKRTFPSGRRGGRRTRRQRRSRGEEIKADIDDLLDEIDDVLETNAEDFVKSYVQKGGQ